MAYEFKIRRLVEFSETDMAGIVHFTNFFRYMEQAEHAFYRSLGLSVVMDQAAETVSLPRVHAACAYRRPLRFEDEFEVHLLVKQKRAKAIVYEFRFRRLSGQEEQVAHGELAVVCVSRDNRGQMKAVELPAALADRIDEAPRELFPSEV